MLDALKLERYLGAMQIYLGTWQIFSSDGFWTDQNLSQSESVLTCAIKSGLTCFDTAQSYGKGQAQQTLSKILRRYPNKTFTVDTKIMPSSKPIIDLIKPSLNLFDKIGINCLYLHWPQKAFDNVDFVKQICSLKDKGLIVKAGVCNMDIADLIKLKKAGLQIDRIQRPISLLWARDLKETQAYCKENNIELVAYSPTGMGLLSGKYSKATDLNDARKNLFCFEKDCYYSYLDLLNHVKDLANTHQTSPTSIALSWTMAQNIDIILLGARTPEQLKQNLATKACLLTDQEQKNLTDLANNLAKASQTTCQNIFSYS